MDHLQSVLDNSKLHGKLPCSMPDVKDLDGWLVLFNPIIDLER